MYNPTANPRIDFGAYGSPVLAGQLRRAMTGAFQIAGSAGKVVDFLHTGYYLMQHRWADATFAVADAVITGLALKSRNPYAVGGALGYSYVGGMKTFADMAELGALGQACSGIPIP